MKKLIGLFFAALLFAGPVHAVVVYSQLPDPVNYNSGPTTDGVAGQFNSVRMADNFNLGSNATVTGVAWWGGSEGFNDPDLTNFDSFAVTIYASSAGMPGGAVYSETFLTADTHPTLVGHIDNSSLNPNAYRHNVTFTAPVSLSGGTEYWLSIGSINADPDGDGYTWIMALASVDDVTAFDDFAGTGWGNDLGDLAFEVHAVPLPAAVWLFGSGLVGLFAVGRRRRSLRP